MSTPNLLIIVLAVIGFVLALLNIDEASRNNAPAMKRYLNGNTLLIAAVMAWVYFNCR